ncbi:hypothetical protein SAMN04488564_1272 [Lentzea waywayandensis]|uniref:Universal stress protein family protein n=1 Tax=Lentzea waywayandensis TaxID=84724 RepID=A0A1I6FJF3_9PSEU|nr:hypothetical protein [Lentzea waywayandensis]SFR30066.1 hypothetical protein SAMN04488564_1272 [Lentzea waywayandensis]
MAKSTIKAPVTQVPRRKRSVAKVDASRLRGSVVVGVDGSSAGYHAFEWAARHAVATCTDLQVYDMSARSGPLAGDETLHRVLRRLPTLTAHFRLGGTNPVRTMTTSGAEQDILVLAGSGHTSDSAGLKRRLIQAAITRTRSATVLVQGRPEAIRGEYGWVTAVVGRGHEVAVLDSAITLCRVRGAQLRVVHLRPLLPGQGNLVNDSVVSSAAAYLRDAAPDLSADFILDRRQPHESFAALHSDLVVLERGHQGAALITRTALYHAACPVLIVQC